MSPLLEIAQALALVIGTVVSSTLFYIGYRLYKIGPHEYQRALSMKKRVFRVNLKTHAFEEVLVLKEEALDIILGEKSFRPSGLYSHLFSRFHSDD